MSLISEVRSGLQLNKGRWPLISRRAGVSYSWLTKFAQGRIANPGARQLESVEAALREPMAGQPPAESDTAGASHA